MKTDEKHVFISLPVPEHEKETVALYAQDRDINLTLSRRYQDETRDALTGIENKIGRSEMLTEKFKVEAIVDSKNITKKWDQGILTFTLPKA